MHISHEMMGLIGFIITLAVLIPILMLLNWIHERKLKALAVVEEDRRTAEEKLEAALKIAKQIAEKNTTKEK